MIDNTYLAHTILLINNHEHYAKYHRNRDKTLIEYIMRATLMNTPQYCLKTKILYNYFIRRFYFILL